MVASLVVVVVCLSLRAFLPSLSFLPPPSLPSFLACPHPVSPPCYSCVGIRTHIYIYINVQTREGGLVLLGFARKKDVKAEKECPNRLSTCFSENKMPLYEQEGRWTREQTQPTYVCLHEHARAHCSTTAISYRYSFSSFPSSSFVGQPCSTNVTGFLSLEA